MAPWLNLLEQNVFHEARAHGIDSFEGLVHEKEFRAMDQRGGHGHALAHAFGIFADQFAGVFGQLEELQQFAAALFGLRLGQTVDAADKLEIFGARSGGRRAASRREPGRFRGGFRAISPAVACRARGWCPASGCARPISILMVVVLPAPLGPRKPKKQRCGTTMLRPSTAGKPL